MAARKADPELDAALAAIAAEPGDDARKRVLTDLLLDRGDARGEFLLLQFLIAEKRASGAMRQRAENLWRSHRRAWMAGVEKVLDEVRLEHGFPVDARVAVNATVALTRAALESPMVAGLRVLRSSHSSDAAWAELVGSPKVRALTTLEVPTRELLDVAAARPHAALLRHLLLRFALDEQGAGLLLGAPRLRGLEALNLPTGSRPRAIPRRWQRQSAEGRPEKETPVAKVLRQLSAHPALRRVTLWGDPPGARERFLEVAALWPALRFERVVSTDTFELSREGADTEVLLQNLTVEDLKGLRPLLPPGTRRVAFMPANRGGLSAAPDWEALRRSFGGVELRLVP